MIISHKYKFIFIKTTKTASTSIEAYLSPFCGKNDVFTPFKPEYEGHQPRNYKGFFNPIPDIMRALNRKHPKFSTKKVFMVFAARKRFYSHIPAILVESKLPDSIWNNYFKFSVERNPFDKIVSHYYHVIHKNPELDFNTYLDNESYRKVVNYPLYTDFEDNVIVDQVIRYEDLNRELSEVFIKLGIPFNGELNTFVHSQYRGNRRPYWEFWNDYEEWIPIIKDVFKREMDLMNYSYGGGK